MLMAAHMQANGNEPMTLQQLFGIEIPIIQAPMAGSQGSALALTVSNAGGLGSLPCATLSLEAMRDELAAITAQTDRPVNVNFFCHATPTPNVEREMAFVQSPIARKQLIIQIQKS
jgi:nitronate monooxygenase